MATFLNTRIRLRYDTYTNWNTTNPVLLAGEVAIAVPGTEFGNEGHKTSTASCLMKVGNGTSHFNDLPWLSAVAADVHTWAKKSEAEFKTWLTSADGPALATQSEVAAVAGRVTTLEGKVKTMEETTLPGLRTDVDAVEGRMDTAEDNIDTITGRVEALETATGANGLTKRIADLEAADAEQDSLIAGHATTIGEHTTAIATINGEGEGSIKKAVADEKARAELAEKANADAIDAIEADYLKSDDKTALENQIDSVQTALQGNINTVSGVANAADTLSKANKDAIDILNGNAETEGSVRYTAADVVNTLIGGANDADTITNVKDLIDYVNTHGSNLSGLTTTVNGHTETLSTQAGQISDLQAKDDELVEDIGEINTKIGTATLTTTDKTLIGAINEVSSAVTSGDATTLQDAKDYVDGKVQEINGINSALESRVKANEDKLAGIEDTTVIALIEAAEGRAAGDAQDKADAAQAAAIAAAATDAQTKADAAKTAAIADADGKFATVNSNITALQDFDKTALVGEITSAEGVDTLGIKLNGTALDLVFVCGGASV